MAKASADGGATHYVAEGDPVPGDLPEGVRLVGPGAPVAEGAPEDAGQAPEAEAPDESGQGEPEPEASSPAGADDEDGPPDYMAYRVVDLRDLARDRGLPVTGAKADLAASLAAWDAEHPDDNDDSGEDGG